MGTRRDLVFAIRLAVLGACCAVILAPTAGTCRPYAPPPQESNFDLEGPITKQAPGKLTIDQGQGIYFRVAYDEKTPITKDDGSAASEKDLKIGVRVHVAGDLQDSGEIKAARIEIEVKQGSSPKEQPPQQP